MKMVGLDELTIKNICCACIIGCNPEERVKKQPILLTVTLFLDVHEAALSDDLRKTVDYSKLYKALRQLVDVSEYQLIETLAEKISEYALNFDDKIQKVRVHIVKPQALSHADFPELVVVREK
ncbi:MAG: dihydroneopterin aldolase [Lentisphaeria bacterium]